MPSSKFLIASNTLTTTAASVTFSSIPATYDDLLLVASVRTTASGAFSNLGLVINGNTSAIYSFTRLGGSGSVAFTNIYSGQNAGDLSFGNGDTSTTNTFNSLEMYIPSYRVSRNKPVQSIIMQENNATQAYIYTGAQLFSSTSAITSIQITEASGNNLKSGSTFWLYGLKSS